MIKFIPRCKTDTTKPLHWHLRKCEALTLRAWHSLIGRSSLVYSCGEWLTHPTIVIFRARSNTIGPHPISLSQATQEPGPRTLACPHRYLQRLFKFDILRKVLTRKPALIFSLYDDFKTHVYDEYCLDEKNK